MEKKGQSLIEYVLTMALIAIALIVTLTFLGNRLATSLTKIHVEPQPHVH